MITVLEYLVIAAVIGAAIFGIVSLVFGRGEQMAALPARISPSELPAADIRGDHVREVRFGLALRGYRMSDVDWTLDRLADEIDRLQAELDATGASTDGPDDTDDTDGTDNNDGDDAWRREKPRHGGVTPSGTSHGAVPRDAVPRDVLRRGADFRGALSRGVDLRQAQTDDDAHAIGAAWTRDSTRGDEQFQVRP